MDLAALAQQATDILVPALPFIYEGGKKVAEKGKDLLIWGGKEVAYKSKDMILERSIERVSPEIIDRAKSLLNKLSPKMSESLEKVLTKVSKNPEDPKAKEEVQQEILKLLRENPDLSREIELIVNINLNIDLVKQIIFGNNNLVLNLEGLEGEELIKVMEYLDWKRKESMKEELSKNYSPSSMPQYNEDHIKFVTISRAEEISKASKSLQKNKLLFFSGIAGVGKTTLARVILEFRPASVPNPFWFSFQHNQDVNLETMLEILAGYLHAPDILSFKGTRKAGIIDINRLTDELMNRDPVWLVFDDLSYITDTQRKFKDPEMGLLFLALRDNTHQAKIILTSRVLPMLNNGERLIDELEDENKEDLKGLEIDFAIDYLKANGLGKIEYNTLKSLSESVDGHPFSLKLLTELARRHSLENILKNPSIYKKSKEERIKNAKFLFDKLAGEEKELLERISVFRKPEPLEAINIMLTDCTPIDSVDTLLDKSLLETDHIGNYWLHPLVQEFSYEDLKNKKEVHLIAYDYYKSLKLPENPAKKEDLQSAIEAHYHACMAEEYDLAADIIWESNLHYLLDLWGNPRTLIEIYEKLLPEDHFKNEPILKDEKVHGAILGNLGNAYRDLGEPKKAIDYYKHVLKISRKSGDRRFKGVWLGNLGLAYRDLGEPKKAIDYYKHVLKISRKSGDRRFKGVWLGNLGLAYRYLGEPKRAIKYSKQALKISRKSGDRCNEGAWLGCIGLAYGDLSELKKAIEYYEQALKIAREFSDRRREGSHLEDLGLAYSQLGETKKAIEYYEQALRISREIGDRRREGNCLGNLGLEYIYLGESKKAIEYSEQALKISKEIGNRRGEGNCLRNLGNANRNLGKLKKAIEYYEHALKISKEIGNRRGEGTCLGNLGGIYGDMGEIKKAIEYSEQALTISKEIGYRRGEGDHLGNLGLAYNHLGETKKAIEYYEQALKIAREIGNKRGEGRNLGFMGLAYSQLGEIKKAIEYYEGALTISKEMGYRRGEGDYLGFIGLAYSQLGETEKAIEYYEQALKIAREIGNRRGEGRNLGFIGLAYSQMGETKKAIEYSEQALTISKEIDYRRGEGDNLGNLGAAYYSLGETKKAIEYSEQALTISKEIGYRRGEGNHLGNLGLAYSQLGETKKAIEYYEQALKIAREIGNRCGEGSNLGFMGLAYSQMGETKKAIKFLKQSLVIEKTIEDQRIIGFCEQKLKELEGAGDNANLKNPPTLNNLLRGIVSKFKTNK